MRAKRLTAPSMGKKNKLVKFFIAFISETDKNFEKAETFFLSSWPNQRSCQISLL